MPNPDLDYMDALTPRGCRQCGAWTGSVALDWCEDCERARVAVEMMHALATSEHARAVEGHVEGQP